MGNNAVAINAIAPDLMKKSILLVDGITKHGEKPWHL